MTYVGFDLELAPLYVQSGSYDARADRKWFADFMEPGIVGADSFEITFDTALNVAIAGGMAWVLGGNVDEQGMYRCYEVAGDTITVPVDATNPTIHTIILRVFDTLYDGSGYVKGRVELVPGTPTTGATLGNLNGANDLSDLDNDSQSYLLLGYVLAPAAAVALTSTVVNVLDARVAIELKESIAPITFTMPAGSMIDFAGSAAPSGWLLCDGSAISRTDYADLFAACGVVYGVGNGTTTFNIPDARGRVDVMVSSGGPAAINGLGDNDGVTVNNRNIVHEHTLPNHADASALPGDAYGWSGNPGCTPQTLHTSGDSNMVNSPAYLVVNRIIKT